MESHEGHQKTFCLFLRLFAQEGYEAVSVSQIAGELGLTKGALYRHYANKQAILKVFFKKWNSWTPSARRRFSTGRHGAGHAAKLWDRNA
ncbi:MAG: helix-turn-helix domain-containing protein [Christensenellales bacterium]